MLARELVQLSKLFNFSLLGTTLITQQMGDYPGGEAVITDMEYLDTDEIAFHVKNKIWDNPDSNDGTIGVLCNERIRIV